MNRATAQYPWILIALLTLAGCSSGTKSESSDTAPATYDPSDLHSNIVYPPVAAENGLEGVVMVTVYLDKTGAIKDAEITTSDNSIFNKEALNAVRNTTFVRQR